MNDSSRRDPPNPGLFPATQWTTLLKPIAERQPNDREALERLFRTYREPIIAFIRAHSGHKDAAEDLAHDFILRLLERDDLVRLDRERGRFRGFLCTALRNFLASQHERSRTLKRGAGAEHLCLDDVTLPATDTTTAETEFLRRWTRAVLDEVAGRLRREWEEAGRGREFPDFEPFLWDKQAEGPRTQLASRYALTPNALNVRISRLRERHRSLMREVIRETVGRPEEVDEEIRFLLAALAR